MSDVANTLYQSLQQMTLSEDDLCRFGYPRQHLETGKAVIHSPECHYNIQFPHTRICQRCKTSYSVDELGYSTTPSTCAYHWSKLSTGSEPIYYCCRRNQSSPACSTAPQHVSDGIEPNNLIGFISTQHNNFIGKKGIFAIDCEMVFTTAGMDVAAISIVDSNCEKVYETLVVPDAPIIDFNTKHSSLTRQQFLGVTTRLQDVHNKLLTLVDSHTILVGHGLNNDLLRLKVIHDNIVDTSVLYPHPRGLPFKAALVFLQNKHLGRGPKHTTGLKCRGDAQAAMRLVHLKCQ
ncbi:RNA exonuclease 1 homolog [Procambarus clarkii]|uniref:RNA exonuclease 1 homolog n=1 Tax=Procambarus clarkii TaxID=6728 RepID=UPI003743B553